MKNINIHLIILVFIFVFFIPLKTVSQSYSRNAPFIIYDNYIVIEKDTVNRYNLFNEKDGLWLKYKFNLNFTIICHDCDEYVFKEDYLSSMSPNYELSDIIILEYQYYNNGQKVGVWNGFYPKGEKHYDAVFSNNHLKKVFLYQKHSGKKMKFVKKKGKGIYFAKRLNTWEKITEEEVNQMFGWE